MEVAFAIVCIIAFAVGLYFIAKHDSKETPSTGTTVGGGSISKGGASIPKENSE